MSEQDKLAQIIIDILKGFRNLIILPTDKTIESTFKWSLILSATTTVCALLKVYTFISWQGAWLCTGVLFALLYKERRENDALLRMYHSVELSARKIKSRAENASTNIRMRRNHECSHADSEETGTRKSFARGTGDGSGHLHGSRRR